MQIFSDIGLYFLKNNNIQTMFDLQHKIILKVLLFNLLCLGVTTCIALLNNLSTGTEDGIVELYFRNSSNNYSIRPWTGGCKIILSSVLAC